MDWKTFLAACVGFVIKWFLNKLETVKEKRDLKNEALKQIREGIKKRDVHLVTSGFERISRM